MPSPATGRDDGVRRFFLRVLPALVVARLREYMAWKGSIAFEVGARSRWTFTFASDEPVVEGARKEADLNLRFSESAFADFVAGKLDAAAAVLGGEVTASGDLRLLEAFGRLLDPPADSLGWEFQPARSGRIT